MAIDNLYIGRHLNRLWPALGLFFEENLKYSSLTTLSGGKSLWVLASSTVGSGHSWLAARRHLAEFFHPAEDGSWSAAAYTSHIFGQCKGTFTLYRCARENLFYSARRVTHPHQHQNSPVGVSSSLVAGKSKNSLNPDPSIWQGRNSESRRWLLKLDEICW